MDEFRWTTELTKEFIKIRLQHECIFKKKKQSWKKLLAILLKNNFPLNLTTKHIAKKWNYTYDEYHKAVALNNTKWIYYDIFNKYLGEMEIFDKFPDWTTEWILKLIEVRIQNDESFEGFNNDTDASWNVVEFHLREMGLPDKCSVKSIDKIWKYLLNIYKGKCMHKIKEKIVCPFYDAMKQYFEHLDRNEKISVKKKHLTIINSDNDSDNEPLNVLKKVVGTSKLKTNNLYSCQNLNEKNSFRWTQEWTESFLHIRLQNEKLFKENKKSWRILHGIMMDNGFPESMTIDNIKRKWRAVYDDYKKATVLNNTSWIYYTIMHGYLQKTDYCAEAINWPDVWIKKLIYKRTTHNLIFTSQNEEEESWLIIERELRKEGIPSNCSLRNINIIWTWLTKLFMIKHKYIVRNRIDNNWPFYEDMNMFFLKCDPDCLILAKTKDRILENETNNKKKSDFGDANMNESDSFIKKEEYPIYACRICLGTSSEMISLFQYKDNMMWSDRLLICTSIQVTQNDGFPQYICENCLKQLQIAYKFKLKCDETYETFEKLKRVKTEDYSYQSDMNREADSETIISEVGSYSLEYLNDMECKGNNNVLSNELFCNTSTNQKRKIYKKDTKKIPCKSKNIIMVQKITESGERVYKRTYKYWVVCDICGKSTQKMKEHMKSHQKEQSFKCSICPKMFTYKASLQTHLRTHSSTPLKICQLCGKNFFRNITYKRHMVFHANERKFACETCGKSFNTNDILRVHLRSHTGERPYSCQVCAKAFMSRGCVARHQKVHKKHAEKTIV